MITSRRMAGLRPAGMAIIVALALGACSSAPPVKHFEPVLGAGFANSPANAKAEPPVSQFWRGFNDPLLDSLVERALSANTDVRSAAASLRE
ncbi:MAG TPA: hypothetical protein VN089_24680, partial [Duganella sp.]|nr:hypothetical protein [Duganella sp.]